MTFWGWSKGGTGKAKKEILSKVAFQSLFLSIQKADETHWEMGIAWVPLVASLIELIPGKMAWPGGWIWPHEALWPPGFCSSSWMMPIIALVAAYRRPLLLLPRVIAPFHRVADFHPLVGGGMVMMERRASVVKAREAAESWDCAHPANVKLMLKAKTITFQMLKL